MNIILIILALLLVVFGLYCDFNKPEILHPKSDKALEVEAYIYLCKHPELKKMYFDILAGRYESSLPPDLRLNGRVNE